MRLPCRRTLAVLGLTVLVQVTASVQPTTAAHATPPSPVTPSAPAETTAAAPSTTPPAETTAPIPAPATTPDEPTHASSSAPPDARGENASIDARLPGTPIRPPTISVATSPKYWMRRDVVVYGGTPAGVAAAVAAAEQGATVVLVSESTTVGGMMSNGISASDIGSGLAVQGLAKRFFDRIRAYYHDPSTWRFEPRVAERVLTDMLRAAGVRVIFDAPLHEARVTDRRITCARFGRGVEACGKTFIDASYTGDLIGMAGVPHRLGMGDWLAYAGEQLPGLRGWTTVLTVPDEGTAAARAAFADNPFVSVEEALESYDQAHRHGTPSVTYRLCVTRTAGNKAPFQPGPDYDALVPSFRLLAGRLKDEVLTKSNGTLLSDAFHLAVLPNGKYDLNAGRLSFTNLPSPAGYFDVDTDRRAANRQIREYIESFFYFVQTDDAVPPSIQETFAPFGLCADEFVDNGNWPREPYVREGRRIQGRYTVTEYDVFTAREKRTAVALASYNLDSKLSQFVFADGALYRDMGIHSTAPVYEIPYSAMLPTAGSVVNLLAPVGVSASPTAYGSIRMEPQYMALAEAAGVAAALGDKTGRTVSAVSVASIQRVLRTRGTVHRVEEICLRTPRIFRAAGGYTFYCDVLPMSPRILE